jgi:hypothetical protein
VLVDSGSSPERQILVSPNRIKIAFSKNNLARVSSHKKSKKINFTSIASFEGLKNVVA